VPKTLSGGHLTSSLTNTRLTLGNSKRIYLVVTALLLVWVVYQITREDALLQPGQRLQQLVDGQPQLVVDPGLLASANSELARAQKTLNTPVANPAAAINQVPATGAQADASAPDAWHMGDATSPIPSMPVPGGVAIYAPVAIDMENPAYPQPGEKISVTMPGGERLQVKVETGITNPNGDYTWRGHLEGHGDEYPVVMTYGGNSVFATVTTPKGSYTLESVNGSGWLYKNPSEFELSNPGAKDYLEIPHDHN
jgi:hypothetical protein